MIIAVLCPPDLVLLVRSGPLIRDLGGLVRIWGEGGQWASSNFLLLRRGSTSKGFSEPLTERFLYG